MEEHVVVHGIRFYWDYDSEAYVAQVSPDDILDVFDLGVEHGTTQGSSTANKGCPNQQIPV